MSDEEKIIEIMNEVLKCNKVKFEYLEPAEKFSSEFIEECLKTIKPEIDKELKKRGLIDDKGNPTQRGVCHINWALKKQLMREKFKIDWKSISERAPWIYFD